jgi:hypothetical protein
MTMHFLPRLCLGVAILLVLGGTARAQDSRFSIAVKGGLNAENSEDNIQGTTPALGLTGSVGFAHGWRGEVEFWLPGYIEDERGDPKHRDILFSFSAVKSFGAGRARPFVVMGLSLARVQDWFSFCTAIRPNGPNGSLGPVLVSCDEPDLIDQRRERNDGNDGYLLGGGGVEWRMNSRLGLVADIRLSLAPTSVLVRPAVGLVVNF